MGSSKTNDAKPSEPSDPMVIYGVTAISLLATIWLCGSTLHLLAPDDFSGAFLFRSAPISTMTILKSAFEDPSMAVRSTAYTEICQDNAGPNGFDKNLDKPRAPFPPFNHETALQKVKAAEAAWNSRDPELVSKAYSTDALWRNRDELFIGREAIKEFLTRKWERETNYRLIKNLWSWHDNRIAVRFTYEYQHVESGQWYRCHGNELWQFDDKGYMQHRDMSGNDVPINETQRLYHFETEYDRRAAAAAAEAAEAAARAAQEERERLEAEEMKRVEAELRKAEAEAAEEAERVRREAEAAEAARKAAEAQAKREEEERAARAAEEARLEEEEARKQAAEEEAKRAAKEAKKKAKKEKEEQ